MKNQLCRPCIVRASIIYISSELNIAWPYTSRVSAKAIALRSYVYWFNRQISACCKPCEFKRAFKFVKLYKALGYRWHYLGLTMGLGSVILRRYRAWPSVWK